MAQPLRSGTLPERAVFRKLFDLLGHRFALADQIFAHRATQSRMNDVMRRIGRHRHVAAQKLVLALRPRLDALQPARDGEIDGLIVAGLEMEERHILKRTPVRPKITPPPNRFSAPAI